MQQLVAKTPVEAEVLKSELLRYRFTAGEGKKPYTVVTSAPPIVVESIVRARCLDVVPDQVFRATLRMGEHLAQSNSAP